MVQDFPLLFPLVSHQVKFKKFSYKENGIMGTT